MLAPLFVWKKCFSTTAALFQHRLLTDMLQNHPLFSSFTSDAGTKLPGPRNSLHGYVRAWGVCGVHRQQRFCSSRWDLWGVKNASLEYSDARLIPPPHLPNTPQGSSYLKGAHSHQLTHSCTCTYCTQPLEHMFRSTAEPKCENRMSPPLHPSDFLGLNTSSKMSCSPCSITSDTFPAESHLLWHIVALVQEASMDSSRMQSDGKDPLKGAYKGQCYSQWQSRALYSFYRHHQ